MSVVKINAITVPNERADELVARFAARAGEVSTSPGFEAFELLRPTDDRDTFLVYTRWASEDDFQAWMSSPAFQHGHRPTATRVRCARTASCGSSTSSSTRTRPLPSQRTVGLTAQVPRGLGVRRDRHERDRGHHRARRVAVEARGGKYVWIATIVAESALMLQVLVGTILVASKDYVAPRFHMFYGFVAFLTVGIAYQYRQQMRGRREMFYGLVGLFLMGLGIRAVLQAG